MAGILGLARRHPLLAAGFVLAALATLVFAVRLALATLVWTVPALRDQPPAGWMTPRYVAMSWDVPPEVVRAALDLPQDGTGRRVTLAELAAERGVSVELLTQELAQAIAAHRTEAAP
jgi:hypothetical protein